MEAEQGLRVIAAQTGMEVVIICSPLVHGPGVKANFAALMRAMACGLPLPLGLMRNLPSLVGLKNLVDFIMLCAVHSAAASETFRAATDQACPRRPWFAPWRTRPVNRAGWYPCQCLCFDMKILVLTFIKVLSVKVFRIKS